MVVSPTHPALLLGLALCACERNPAPTAAAPVASAVPVASTPPAPTASEEGNLLSQFGKPETDAWGPPEDMDCPPRVDESQHCVELLVRSASPARAQALAKRLRREGFPFSAEGDRVTGYLDVKAIERLFQKPPSYSANMASATDRWICELVIQGDLSGDYARDVEGFMADDPVCEL